MTNSTNKQPTIAELAERLEALEELVANIKTRDRGPKSTRPMTDQDAYDVMFGKYSKLGHKAAAAETGLSYGQVYSARGGYTFTHIKADWSPTK